MKIALLALTTLAAPLAAQSFNLDCGSVLGSPADTYGAAADQPGRWNVFDGGTINPFPLVGLAGEPLAARFVQQLPFGTSSFAPPFGSDLVSLLGDYFDLHSIPHQFAVTGLEAGLYELWFYAWPPDFPEAFVTAVGIGEESQLVGGPWPGGFVEEITHAHFVTPVHPGQDLAIATFGFGKGTMNGLQVAARELWTRVALAGAPPAALAPNVEHELLFDVDPRDEALAAAPRLWLRFVDPAPGHTDLFQPRRVRQTGPTQWSARVPAAQCGETVELYLEVEGTASGVQHLPLPGPAAPLRLPVGYARRELRLAEGFDAGLPAGFVATGLWHASSSCAPPSCGGGPYLYYGVDGTCDYTDGTANQGSLLLPPVDLSAVHPAGASAELRFCSLHRTVNDFLGRARVFANGVELAELPQSVDWVDVALDLTPFVGGPVSIELLFESNHAAATNELGWLVDDLAVELLQRPCPPSVQTKGPPIAAPVDPAQVEPGAHAP